MKKILPIMLMAVTVACSASTKKIQATNDLDAGVSCVESSCPMPGPDAAKITDLVAEDNWQFILPGPGWKPVAGTDDTIKVAFENDQLDTKLVLVKEPTTQTKQEYIVNILRSIHSNGTSLKNTVVVNINGNEFINTTVFDDTHTGWFWFTLKDGNGYVFACAVDKGLTEADDTTCTSIANTLKIQ